ncbi:MULTISPECIES: type VI secretion system baseplate subunit TssG [unclassified Pseudomonas]|uniref:type VI secretion system baseplate subunit TssG n=1 Tax=unclassified Pseudomonas TaxID=196821 RepID=UPI0021C8CF0E|nr:MULTISPECIES: type VI secretion system baseplate subunit TssG [unclassified Pseudomonas]MCU1735444.1 type VI secretion system baseplate subunit TssG [Pseudomonas sp. 20P_3.2_Bac4]MCU1745374.1 type VI secretion system baseplate subunit TssG [Pseudomonas sp. 20P_3.2_Bac5]
MEPASRHAAVPLSETLRARPEGFELLQALLILEHENQKATSLGRGSVPQNEAVRLRGPLTPAFPASQIEKISHDAHDPRPILSTPIFGLGGPDGPLPYAFQEWLQQRALERDHAPAEFLDLFQHRLLSLLYRTLRKHRVALGFAEARDTPVQQQLRALAGLLPAGLQDRQKLPDAALLARTALITGGRRSLAGFASIVRHHFNLPLRVEGHDGAWCDIPPASRSVLKRGGRNLQLGRTAIAGKRMWDEHAGIRLHIGPLSAEQAKPLLPGGDTHHQLADLAALYFGPDLDCALTLLIDGARPMFLMNDNRPRLNWNNGLQRKSDPTRRQVFNTRLQQPAEV